MDDPTAQDVREGNATYDATNGVYVWLPGKDPSQFSPGTVQATPVWDSGTGSAVVTVNAPPTDHSLAWLLLGLAATWWVLEG